MTRAPHSTKVTAKVSAQHGFTLIELLIALAVSAVIAALAYQAVNGMVKLQAGMQSHTERSAQVQRAFWWLEQDFIQMVPRPISDGYGSDAASSLPALQYRADLGVELTRAAQFPTPNANGGLLRVGYVLDGDTLVRLVWPVLDRAPDTQPSRQVVLSGVNSFSVRFLSSLPNATDSLEGASAAWLDLWPSSSPTLSPTSSQSSLSALPILVEVQAELNDLGVVTRLFMGVDAVEWGALSGPVSAAETPEIVDDSTPVAADELDASTGDGEQSPIVVDAPLSTP